MKKLLSTGLALCLAFSALAAAAFAEEESDGPESPEPTAAAEPTDTTEPTAAPQQTEAPASAAVRLQIDDKNVYEGMDKAYKDGYVPQVSDGAVTLVMPVLASGPLLGNEITVTPDLGDTYSSPIQYRNYQKTFPLADNPVNDSGEEGQAAETVSSYLVRFDLPLREQRANGVYPVTLEVQARGADGAAVRQSFTCYVTITDGESTDVSADVITDAPAVYAGGGIAAAEAAEPESNPRVLVSKYAVSAVPVRAGEDFTVTVTLRNTSDTRAVQNMLVTVTSESANFVLKNDSATIFLGSLGAGETKELELAYGTDLETPPRRYAIHLQMEYDDSDAMTMSSSGSVTVEVAQAMNVALSPFYLPSDVNAGETASLSFQVMNLGRGAVYNVRVELDVPGLSPSGTAFIGNMEPGTSAEASMNVFAGMKEGDERYGYTGGTARLIYEDAGGREYTDEMAVSTNIKELVIAAGEETETEEESRTVQWWIAAAAGAAVILALALPLRRRGRKASRHSAA